ncbi:ABC transporter ATP-binding protein [Kutzneria sp. 744]|uniref:ABC transporter ATP-binding protein n=1 Tax=Kutzneria sp. (strain 744) TaxID=345341 RepID=UPI0003EEBD5E|nr:ABC transporter ATP-binding protein [Kutzneria sp. 744]EWM19071.1 iron complex transporter ATP-binding protein [Kutzneria sp. 744]
MTRLDIAGLAVDLAGVPVLRDVDLTVEPGCLLGLVGPNGSGKSTLLRTIYKSVRPLAGTVLIDGDDVRGLSTRAAAQRTGAVLQDAAGPGGLTVAETVALGRNPHHGLLTRESMSDRDAIDDARRTHRHDTVRGPSGHLARALAQRPRLLVTDEVTNHLDIRARFEMLELVRGLGVTTVAVLHELDLAARCCDRIVVLDAGRVAAAGPVLDALTPEVLHDVFGVHASADRHDDGVIRIRYDAKPLAARGD